MSEPQIPNYDPTRGNRSDEEMPALGEIVLLSSDTTPLASLYLPKAELSNKTDEEVSCYIYRASLLYQISDESVSVETLPSSQQLCLANSLALLMNQIIKANLIFVYLWRIEKGDGQDPEIPQGDAIAENVLYRICDHLHLKLEKGIVCSLTRSEGLITQIHQELLRSAWCNTVLLTQQEKGAGFIAKHSKHLQKRWHLVP